MTRLQPVGIDRDSMRRRDPGTAIRRRTVKPGRCGPVALFVGQLGDWTWETVGELCATDVFQARNSAGEPTYLAFCYLHLMASAAFHPQRLTFGDELEVVSRCFDFGSESILTLHRIERASGASPGGPFGTRELYRQPHPDRLYVESFNRWITRGRPDSNRGLVKSSPRGFEHRHLPALPECHSPRIACRLARTRGSFGEPSVGTYTAPTEVLTVDREIDLVGDVNGVGLIHYAAFFAIVDKVLLRWWRSRGRSDHSFLSRVTLDHKLSYFANAELDAVLRITLRRRRRLDVAGHEVFDTVIRDRDDGTLIAVSTAHVLAEVDDETSS